MSTILSTHDLSRGYEFEKNEPELFQEFEVVAKATAQFPNFRKTIPQFLHRSFKIITAMMMVLLRLHLDLQELKPG